MAFWGFHFDLGRPGPSEPLNTVHPVHPLATPLLCSNYTSYLSNKMFLQLPGRICDKMALIVGVIVTKYLPTGFEQAEIPDVKNRDGACFNIFII